MKQTSGENVSRQVELLAGLRPHVVVLQEAYRGQVERYRDGLAARTSTRWEARYAPVVRRLDGNEGAGVIALSSWPIESHDVLMMAHADRWTKARPALRIRVRHPESRTVVDIVTTHLAAGEDGAGARARQAEELAGWLTGSTGATLLAGDFNAEPGSPDLRVLSRGFVDVWPTVGSGGGETFSSDRPTRRIDYWWSRGGGLAPIESAVIDVCRGGACLSDHRALFAAFRVASR